MNKNNNIYIVLSTILFLLILVIYVLKILQINTNLDTTYDEGFLFLRLQNIVEGGISGMSQWEMIIYKVFGAKICAHILNLRYVSFYVHFLSVLIWGIGSLFYLLKQGILKHKLQKAWYLMFVVLFGLINTGTIIVSYNQLQEFFIVLMLLSFLFSTISSEKYIYIWDITFGFFSFFSIITILPSGLVIFIILFLLTCIKSQYIKHILMRCVVIFIGFLLGIFIFHFLITDIIAVFNSMLEIAKTVTQLNRGYDPQSFLFGILFYFRDFFIHICTLLGIFLFSKLIEKFLNKYVGLIFFFLSVFVVEYYLKQPNVPLSTLLAFPVVLLFFVQSYSSKNKQFLLSKLNFNRLVIVVLFFFPLMSAIGTNTELSEKMMMFILPWTLSIILLSENISIKRDYIRFSFLFIIFVILFSQINSLKTNMNYYRNSFSNDNAISKIRLNDKQKEYFGLVDSILRKYNYQDKDVVFATQLDCMTIVAISATPCGIYFQPTDFLVEKDTKKLPKPDFLFLTDYDLSVIGNKLEQLNWGFPKDFDVYDVGTPEIAKLSYPTERKLFCRKIKN